MRHNTQELTLNELFSYDHKTGDVRQLVLPRGSKRSETGSLGYIKNHGYRIVSANRKQYLAHRVAWYLHYGKFPDGVLDHIDGDKLNNRIDNLRECSKKQNSWNMKITKRNSSGFKGVSLSWGKWIVQIAEGKHRHIVRGFETADLANEFAMLMREVLHGAFSRHK